MRYFGNKGRVMVFWQQEAVPRHKIISIYISPENRQKMILSFMDTIAWKREINVNGLIHVDINEVAARITDIKSLQQTVEAFEPLLEACSDTITMLQGIEDYSSSEDCGVSLWDCLVQSTNGDLVDVMQKLTSAKVGAEGKK